MLEVIKNILFLITNNLFFGYALDSNEICIKFVYFIRILQFKYDYLKGRMPNGQNRSTYHKVFVNDVSLRFPQ